MPGIYVHNPAQCPTCQPLVSARLARFSDAMHKGAARRPYMRPRTGGGKRPRHSSSSTGASGGGNSASDGGSQTQQQLPLSSHGGGGSGGGVLPPQPLPAALHLRSLRPTAPRTQLQHGVMRSNCIDCLDRTNVAQFAYGLGAFGRQLQALGLTDSPEIDSDTRWEGVGVGVEGGRGAC